MKKGKYYVGDPCYIFKESWDKVLDETDFFQPSNKITIFGMECAGGNTAHGDGSYYDEQGREYYVDSGSLAIIPVALLDVDKVYKEEEFASLKGMHLIEFEEDFEVNVNNGIYTFGNVLIDTLGEEMEDEQQEIYEEMYEDNYKDDEQHTYLYKDKETEKAVQGYYDLADKLTQEPVKQATVKMAQMLDEMNYYEEQDIFRSDKKHEDGGYIDLVLNTREETLAFVNDPESKIRVSEEVTLESIIKKVNEFWDKHPNGFIEVG